MYEYDREPVSEKSTYGVSNFIGMFSGEHIAGTEFIIGPLFVVHGVTAPDLFIGLLIGNILAVLSWAFYTAPIAVKTRLTVYWQIRKICGPYLTFIYGILYALILCLLSGAMISVSATAVGLPFNMPMPELTDTLPTSMSWVIIVFIVGSVVSLLAILGFEKLALFAKISAPWMFLVFVASALAVLPLLGANSLGDFWRVANEKIWTGNVVEGQSKFTIWHVIFFSWLCNLHQHIGMSDMTIFRYAKKWTYGFASAFGMFLGHYVAWVASGILCAAAMGNVAPGPIAYMGAGVVGAITVVVAGWTTANPTLYRAGLSFQVATPNWKRWKVTLVAGVATTIIACFPAVVMRLLEVVALYGLIFMPVGAFIFIDFWVFPRLNLKSNYAHVMNKMFSLPAAFAWAGSLGFSLLLYFKYNIEIYFLALPGWFVTVILYITFSFLEQRRNPNLTQL
ncbi:hypothetical protein GF406_09155 [candidate division KSB1 bacterium]|nr:hypothetical protein [candidate division KSB1 bacterium]